MRAITTLCVIAAVAVVMAASNSALFVAADREQQHPVRSGLQTYMRNKLRFAAHTLREESASSRMLQDKFSAETARKHEQHKQRRAGLGSCPINTTACWGPPSAGGTVCCEGGQSSQKESCCPDTSPTGMGGVCCVSELTFCCPPQPQFDHPSRCCPRWAVCCNYGRYGCCEPQTMTPLEELSTRARKEREAYFRNAAAGKAAPKRVANGSSSLNFTATALMLEPDWWTGAQLFYSAQIDASTGAYTQKQVTNPDTSRFDPDGEIPRSFIYSRRNNAFYLLQANFTANPAPGSDPKRQIRLYGIDGATAAVTDMVVTGADDQVTGYAYNDAKNVIVFSTFRYAEGSAAKDTPIGFNWYHLNPATAVAKLVSQSTRGPSGSSRYNGWFDCVSEDLRYAYRLGFEHVRTSVNFGIEISDISGAEATYTFQTLGAPAAFNQFKTLTLLAGSTPSATRAVKEKLGFAADDTVFISLAPNATGMSLAPFVWSLSAPNNARMVAAFNNVHTTPDFGPLAEAVSADGTLYTVTGVKDSPWGSNSDTVVLASVDLTTGDSEEMELAPQLLAETCSFAGVAIRRA